MPLEPKIESYLSALDRCLSPISMSDRADIITEIKSHILDAREKNPGESIQNILSSIGEPEVVANRYLLERGLKPHKSPSYNVIKWLTIGFLGTFFLLLCVVVFLAWMFSPIISVNEKEGRVQLFGGMIDVNEETDSFRVGSKLFQTGFDENELIIRGQIQYDETSFQKAVINISNGKINLSTSEDKQLTWNCRASSANGSLREEIVGRDLVFNFTPTAGIKCDFQIPPNIPVKISGSNGKVDIFEPAYPLDIEFANAAIVLAPATNIKYNYDLNVVNGKIDTFNSSTESDALKIKIRVANGAISKE